MRLGEESSALPSLRVASQKIWFYSTLWTNFYAGAGMLRRVLWGLVIVLPAILIFFLPTIAATFSPGHYAKFPTKTLFEGGIYIACDPPFNKSLSNKQPESVSIECEMHEGKNAFHINAEPTTTSKQNSDDAGVAFVFDSSFNRRFEGKTIGIEVLASCDGCTEPVEFRYASSVRGNSGWQGFDLEQKPTTIKFIFNYKDFPDGSPLLQPKLFVDPNNNSAAATVRIYSAAIYEVK